MKTLVRRRSVSLPARVCPGLGLLAGHSIYRNPKETISIWEAYEILETKLKCTFPEKANLELLHEERNSIQHKYANPSADDAAFHFERAMKFIGRFARDELKVDLAAFIPSEFLERVPGS